MISFHPLRPDHSRPWAYGYNWRAINLVGDVRRMAKCMRLACWSPCVWLDGRRSEKHFLRSEWIGLDFESHEYPLAQALKDFGDCVHVIGTTANHQLAKNGQPAVDRFRVALRWSEPVTDLKIYRWNMSVFASKYDLDRKCRDGARFFWPCREIVSVLEDGETWEPDKDVPEDFERPIPAAYWRQARVSGLMPRWVVGRLTLPAPSGERNATIYGLAADLARLGLSAEDILARLLLAPVRNGLPEREMRNTIMSGIRRGLTDDGRGRQRCGARPG